MSYYVEVVPAEARPNSPARLEFERVTDITLIDNESHGQGALGNLPALQGKRLIICSPNVTAFTVEDE